MSRFHNKDCWGRTSDARTAEVILIKRAWKRERMARRPFCHYCGKRLTYRKATVDHVIPVSRGGLTRADNFALSCKRCNEEKADMTLDEFVAARQVRKAEGGE